MTNTNGRPSAGVAKLRNAQDWQDADVLVAALRPKAGETVVSVADAGDNVLALLAEGPDQVIALAADAGQAACLRLRAAMYRVHAHGEFLELMGSRRSGRRRHLLEQVASKLPAADQAFWATRKDMVIKYGAGGVGAVEQRIRTFRDWVLPFVHNAPTIHNLLQPRDAAERKDFHDRSWNIWGWRMMVRLMSSRFMLRRMGLTRQHFENAEGGLPERVARQVFKAMVEQDPSENPYLHWLLKGEHGEALPRALDAERHEIIRDRLDRLVVREGSVATLADEGVRGDAFNLSTLFDGLSAHEHESRYGAFLSAARPGARIAYWNAGASRRMPLTLAGRATANPDLEAKLGLQDKGLFHSDFVIEEAPALSRRSSGRSAD